MSLFLSFFPFLILRCEIEASQLRCSSHSSKGSGGQLQQLHHLEHVQLAKHSWLSARELEVATQEQGVNPMAPSYEPPQEDEDEDEESQVPPWVVSSVPATQAKPSFIHGQPGDQFGFRLPKQAVASACEPEVGTIQNRVRVR